MRVRTLISLLIALSLFACTRETGDVSQTTPSQSSTNTVDPRMAEPGSTAMNPIAPTQQGLPSGSATASQPVQLDEYSIRMPDTLSAGAQKFTIANGGKELHSFEIHGNGVHAKLPADLPRGDSATLEVNLPPGTYEVYCPVEGHKGKGMVRTITVK